MNIIEKLTILIIIILFVIVIKIVITEENQIDKNIIDQPIESIDSLRIIS